MKYLIFVLGIILAGSPQGCEQQNNNQESGQEIPDDELDFPLPDPKRSNSNDPNVYMNDGMHGPRKINLNQAQDMFKEYRELMGYFENGTNKDIKSGYVDIASEDLILLEALFEKAKTNNATGEYRLYFGIKEDKVHFMATELNGQFESSIGEYYTVERIWGNGVLNDTVIALPCPKQCDLTNDPVANLNGEY